MSCAQCVLNFLFRRFSFNNKGIYFRESHLFPAKFFILTPILSLVSENNSGGI